MSAADVDNLVMDERKQDRACRVSVAGLSRPMEVIDVWSQEAEEMDGSAPEKVDEAPRPPLASVLEVLRARRASDLGAGGPGAADLLRGGEGGAGRQGRQGGGLVRGGAGAQRGLLLHQGRAQQGHRHGAAPGGEGRGAGGGAVPLGRRRPGGRRGDPLPLHAAACGGLAGPC